MSLRRDRRSCPYASDVLTEAVARVASVTHNPLRYSRQLLQQGNGVWEFMCLARCKWRVGVRAPDRVQSEKAMARPAASAITQALVP